MKLLKNKKAYAGMIAALVAVLVVISIGMLVFWTISNSIDTGAAAGATVHTNVNTTAQTVFGLAPIVAIVFVASVILAAVGAFGAGAGKKGGL